MKLKDKWNTLCNRRDDLLRVECQYCSNLDLAIKVVVQLEKQNEKLQQDKKELLKALKTVNEIRDQLLKEKKELIEFIEFCEAQGVEGIIETYEEYTCKKWEDLLKIKE